MVFAVISFIRRVAVVMFIANYNLVKGSVWYFLTWRG